uniref:Nucleotide exchange factor SIL1 n=1 Tax=Hemiscolopendra marginata TaxID=943146 RepID=A0A646QEL6_9MYRI
MQNNIAPMFFNRRFRTLLILFIFCLFCFISFPCVWAKTDSGALTIVESTPNDGNKNDVNDVDITEEDDEKHSSEKKIFIASEEWKEIREGQEIPAGLHVRINLQTGKKEAKIISTTDHEERQVQEMTPKYIDKSVVAEALKHFTSDDTFDPKEQMKAENTFKSIDKIKKDFQELKIDFKTEYEVLSDLISRLRQSNITDDDKIELYSDLEYIVHKYDNAKDFVKIGGLQLILPSLNSTNDDVRAMAAFLLGSAMQSNPQVQIAALENALLMHLVRIVIWDPSPAVQNRAMYALSCLVRQFPLAQQKLIDQGGFNALAGVFLRKQHQSDMNKLLLKAVTLISDLMEEQSYVREHLDKNSNFHEEKLRQYNNVRLDRVVKEEGWCQLVPKLLESPDHDEREKVLRAMSALLRYCYSEFKHYESLIHLLVSEYLTLASEESTEDATEQYFTDLYTLSSQLLSNIRMPTKEEL